MEKKTKEDRQKIVKKLFKALSAREKKIVKTDLFGPNYPNEDLSEETCLKIIARLRPSARNKLKPYKIMPHLINHYAIVESDQIEIYDDTITESKRADRVINAINIKSSYSIAALYISLLDSSNDEDGPPTHHQLAYELKRIVQDECTHLHQDFLSVSDTEGLADGPTSIEVMEKCIIDLNGIILTDEQATSLCGRLGVTGVDNDLYKLFEKWIARKGQWCTSNDIVESLLLTQRTGRHVSKLNLPQYQQLKEFLIGVGGDWIHIALYIGFDKSELLLDEDTTDVMSTQLDMFLEIWSMPDCGQKTIVILQKLKNVVLVVPYSGQQSITTKSSSNSLVLLDTVSPTEPLPDSTSLLPVLASSNYSMQSTTHPVTTTTKLPATTVVSTDVYSTSLLPSTDSQRLKKPSTDTITSPPKNSNVSNSKNDYSTALDIDMTTPSPGASITSTVSYVCEAIATTYSSLPTNVVSPAPSFSLMRQSSFSSSMPNVSFLRSSTLNINVIRCDDSTYVNDEILPRIQITHPVQSDLSTGQDSTAISTAAVVTEHSWPQPIQQSIDETSQLDTTYVFTTNTTNFTAPIAVTNTTWTSTSPYSSLKSGTSFVIAKSHDIQPNSLTGSVNSESNKEENDIVPVSSSTTSCTDTSTDVQMKVVAHSDNIEFCSENLVQLLINESEEFLKHLNSLDDSTTEINKPVSLDYRKHGYTLLHVAAKLQLIEHVEVLLNAGANVNQTDTANGVSTLHVVAKNGNLEILHSLTNLDSTDINIRDMTNSTPLLTACQHSNDQCALLLLNSGADIEAINSDNETPLSVAVATGSVDTVNILLERCPQPNLNHFRAILNINDKRYVITPVVDSAIGGHLEILELLVEHGADLNPFEMKCKSTDDMNGISSPLVLACYRDQQKIVQYIINHEKFDFRLTTISDAVVVALQRGSNECVRLIWEKYGGMQQMLNDSSEFEELHKYLTHFKNGTLNEMQAAEDQTNREILLDVQLSTDHNIVHEKENDLSTCEDTQKSDSDADQEDVTVKRKRWSTKNLSKRTTNDLSPVSVASNTQSILTDFPEQNNTLNNFSGIENNNTHQETVNNFLDIDDGDNLTKALSLSTNDFTNNLSEIDQTTEQTDNEAIGNNPLSTSVKPLGGASAMVESSDDHLKQLAHQITTDSETDNPRPKSPLTLIPPSDNDIPDFAHIDTTQTVQKKMIEVLYDFAQYLILACLRHNSPEDIIKKAEDIGVSTLIDFFSKYFYDVVGAVNGSEFVSDFLKKGFPPPFHFLLTAGFCTKNDFMDVLKEFDRLDFPDKLMLAFHQFPESDHLPWSGTELLNALFQASTSIPQRQNFLSLPSTPYQEQSMFPGRGNVLGYGNSRSSSLPQRSDAPVSVPVTSVSNVPVTSSLPVSNVPVTSSLLVSNVPVTSSLPVSSVPVTSSLPVSNVPVTSSLPVSSVPALLTSSVPMVTTSIQETTLPLTMATTTVTVQPVTVPMVTEANNVVPELDQKDELKAASKTERTFSLTSLQKFLISSDSDSDDSDLHKIKPHISKDVSGDDDSSVDEFDPIPLVEKAQTITGLNEKKNGQQQLSKAKGATTQEGKTKKVSTQTKSSPKTNQRVITGKSTAPLAPSTTKNVTTMKKTSPTASKRMPQPSTPTKASPKLLTKKTTSAIAASSKVKSTSTSSSKLATSTQTKKEPVVNTKGSKSKLSSSFKKEPEKSLKKQKGQDSSNQDKLLADRHELATGATHMLIVKQKEKDYVLSLTPVASLSVSVPNTHIVSEMSLFKAIASNMTNWKMLARYLMVNDRAIEVLAMIGTDGYHHTIQMLLLWSTQNKENATYLTLGEALCNCRREDLVGFVIKHAQNPIEPQDEQLHNVVENDDITLTVPINSYSMYLQPIIASRQQETGASKVTLSLKFK